MKSSVIFLIALCIVMSSAVKADTLHNLEGITKDGWKVVVWCETSPCTFITMSGEKTAGSVNERKFDNEHCDYATTYENGKEKYVFHCSKSGKSPLAGTKYIGHFTGECTNLFTCVAGCNPSVPVTLKEFGEFCE